MKKGKGTIMDLRKRKLIRIIAVAAALTAVLSFAAGAAIAFSAGIGSEYEITDGGMIVYGKGDGGYSNSKVTDLDDGLGSRYSYCIQPDLDTPVISRVKIARIISKDSTGNWQALRRIVYFSPSYPGYENNENNVSGVFYTGNFSEDWGIAHLAMSYVFAGRPADLDTYLGTKASDLGDIWTKAMKMGDAMSGETTGWDSCIPDAFRVFVSSTDGYQSMAVGSMEVPGTVVIRKLSSREDITGGNQQYDLKGAKYGIFDDRSKLVKEITLNERGESGEISLSPGNYKMMETEAPKGFALDTSKYDLTVVSGTVCSLEIKDTPITAVPEMLLMKKPEGFDRNYGEGDASLKGAVYCFEYRPNGDDEKAEKTWYFETDENGRIDGKEPSFAEGFKSDELYRNAEGKAVFPLGRYFIREVKPSEGYLADDSVMILEINEDGTDNAYTGFNGPAVSTEKIIRGGIRILKTDLQLGRNIPQGDAKLSGAEFAIINCSEREVCFDGKMIGHGEKVTSIVTDESGIGESNGAFLPYGTYSIKEEKSPEGYRLNEEWEETFSIREDGKIIDLTENCVGEAVMRSGLQVSKIDGELKKSEALGGAQLEGIKITIRNKSSNDVLVRNDLGENETSVNWNDPEETEKLLKEGKLKTVAPGEDIGELIIRWNDERKAYTAETGAEDLPYGTYGIRETDTTTSYQRSDRSEHIIELREDGTIRSSDGDPESILTFSNYVYRSDVKGTKIGDSNSERFAFVPFKITSLTNGETHVVVTDRNGYLFTGDRRTEDELEESETKDTERTVNPFDDLLDKGEIKTSEIEEREKDISMGVWFGTGEYGSVSKMKEGVGALPFDTYVIEELSCENNEGYTLQKFMFTVNEKSLNGIVDLATITDDIPEIETFASASGGKKTAKVSDHAVITDVVKYRDLIPGESYVIKGTLMDKVSGEPLKDAYGKVITAEKSFRANKRSGKVIVKFELDASDLYGKETVVFERMYYPSGHLVALHEDLNDEGQTVTWEEKSETVPGKTVPKTGDVTGICIWMSMFGSAITAMVLIKRKEKKTRL